MRTHLSWYLKTWKIELQFFKSIIWTKLLDLSWFGPKYLVSVDLDQNSWFELIWTKILDLSWFGPKYLVSVDLDQNSWFDTWSELIWTEILDLSWFGPKYLIWVNLGQITWFELIWTKLFELIWTKILELSWFGPKFLVWYLIWVDLDHHQVLQQQGHSWFNIGGVLLRQLGIFSTGVQQTR